MTLQRALPKRRPAEEVCGHRNTMSYQLTSAQTAASSQPTSSTSFSSSPSSDASGSSYGGRRGESRTSLSCQRASSSKRNRRRRSGRGGRSVADKMVKNKKEKERVRIIRQGYEGLCAVVGDCVERGSGHFSKVRTLAAAIRRIEELTSTVRRLSKERGETVSRPNSSEVLKLLMSPALFSFKAG